MPNQAIKDMLHLLNDAGVHSATKDSPTSYLNQKTTVTNNPPAPLTSSSSSGTFEKSQSPLEDIQTLEELKQKLKNFNGCSLKFSATQLVFSDGNPNAPIMVIGEAPGADEDKQGKPFVGLSGQLLDKMFASIGLTRDKHLYITNIVPWRPPGNRQPTSEEITLCLPFLEQHIRLKKPKVLILVGGVSAKALLKSQDGILKLRGAWHSYVDEKTGQAIPTLATLHPAFLLRSPNKKALAWQDLLMLESFIQQNKIFEDL